MILFYELSENSVDAALEKLPLPKSEALEIIESYMEGGSDAAVTGAFGCLVVRIYDGGGEKKLQLNDLMKTFENLSPVSFP